MDVTTDGGRKPLPPGLLRFLWVRLAGTTAAQMLLVSAVLAWASAAGTVGRELILLFCVAIGIARALQMPAEQARLPSLVTPDVLPRALAVSSSVMQVAPMPAVPRSGGDPGHCADAGAVGDRPGHATHGRVAGFPGQ